MADTDMVRQSTNLLDRLMDLQAPWFSPPFMLVLRGGIRNRSSSNTNNFSARAERWTSVEPLETRSLQ